MSKKISMAVVYGDGIGPEIMTAVLRILSAAKAPIGITAVEAGSELYRHGWKSGIKESTWKTIAGTDVMLKAPIFTPSGGGYRSLNVTIRQRLGLYANIRPAVSYHPYVNTKFPNMDVTIIRENEEDLYPGIEYRRSLDHYECIKIATRRNSMRIAKYAFDYALRNNRKKVTCFVKDNIMKMSDGIFYDSFKEVALNYPSIDHEKYILDIGAARLANKPENFDVVLMPNLAGDIISDITAELSGSVGLAGSANIGEKYAVFEAIHGTAPDIAGQGIANPSGLLNAAIMMLLHFKQYKIAASIHNAWLKTLEDGLHTADIYVHSSSAKCLNTEEFTNAIIANLGNIPQNNKLCPDISEQEKMQEDKVNYVPVVTKRTQVGVDVSVTYDPGFFDERKFTDIKIFAEMIVNIMPQNMTLCFISSKGLKLWPGDIGRTDCDLDLLMLRFAAKDVGLEIDVNDICLLMRSLSQHSLIVSKVDVLFMYGDKAGFVINDLR